MDSLIARARRKYHQGLLDSGVLTLDANGIASNADRSSRLSVRIAKGIAERLEAEVRGKIVGQTSGAKFEQLTMEFLSETFPALQGLRPGRWHIAKLGNNSSVKTSDFVPI